MLWSLIILEEGKYGLNLKEPLMDLLSSENMLDLFYKE